MIDFSRVVNYMAVAAKYQENVVGLANLTQEISDEKKKTQKALVAYLMGDYEIFIVVP